MLRRITSADTEQQLGSTGAARQFRKGKNMLNFEEELAKFKPSRDIDHVGDTIVNRDITDVTDIMVEFLKEQYGQYEEEDHRE